jgi:hypothetical protein
VKIMVSEDLASLLRAAVTEGKAETECLLSQCAGRALHRPDNCPYWRLVFGMIFELTLVRFRPGPPHYTLLCLFGHFSLRGSRSIIHPGTFLQYTMFFA